MMAADLRSFRFRIAPAVVFLAGWTATAFAQQDQLDPEALFRQLDANQDGRLTMDEGGPGSRQMLRRLLEMAGKKENDSITREEFRRLAEQHRRGAAAPARPAAAPRSNPRPLDSGSSDRPVELPPLLRALDSNRDGRLSRDELARLSERFNAWDTNHDGLLDPEELRALEQPVARPEADQRSDAEEISAPDSERRGATGGAQNRAVSGRASKRSASRDAAGDRTRSNEKTTIQGRLAGAWRGWVVDGRGDNPNSGQLEMELRIEGDQMTGRELGTNRARGEGLGEGTFVVTAEGNSGNLDATGTGGPTDGREYRGIFELEGDTLKWCVNNHRGRTRPRSFETGGGNYFMILHRQRQ